MNTVYECFLYRKSIAEMLKIELLNYVAEAKTVL